MSLDPLINDFAIRSFRDIGDGDYIAARLAYRAALIPQFLWSGLQAIEKYLKCVLVLNRIRAPRGHDLAQILQVFKTSVKFDIRLGDQTREFLLYLDTYGRHRYYETPYYATGHELYALDRAVWEVRRYARILDYCIKLPEGDEVNLLKHEIAANAAAERHPRRFVIIGGLLESIIANPKHVSRAPLIWQNAFFGRRTQKSVTHPLRMVGGNSPISLHPEILDEVLKYAWLPKDVVTSYRNSR